jgi:molybdopterin/thiamine biosynthesis adenylyltransferase
MQERYKAQIKVIGDEGQQRLSRSTVAIVGLGGLGSAAAPYIFGAGFEKVVLIDHDKVAEHNLHRQFLYSEIDVGSQKATRAAIHLKRVNPYVQISSITEKLVEENAYDLLNGCALVLDCLDNFTSRFTLHRTAISMGIPVVYGASQGTYGEVVAFSSRRQDPCYQCFIPQAPEDRSVRIGRGAFGPVCGLVGALQASEAIKIVSGVGDPSYGRLFRINVSNMETLDIRLIRDVFCPNHA